MHNTFLHKRIPTLGALILLIVGIAITTFFAQNGVPFIGRATPSTLPENVKVTNITDRSFTVTFTTPDKTASVVSYGTDKNLSETTLDDRDKKTGSIAPYLVHQITIPNLQPNTTYYFSITNGQDTYLDNGNPYQTQTAPALGAENPNAFVVSGTILFANQTERPQGIIYVSLENSQILSALSEDNGTFRIPLATIRTKDLSSYSTVTEDDIATTNIIVPTLGQSTITSSIKASNPLPPISTNQNYNFVSEINQNTNQADSTQTQTGGFPLSSFSSSEETLKIISPEPNAALTDTRPTFKGTAPANEIITIRINTNGEINQQATANTNGQWSFRPTSPLPSGTYAIQITGNDASKTQRTITQNFTILPQGSQVQESATPSATIQPSPTLQPTTGIQPTITPTLTQIPSPTTPQYSPTPTLTQAPIENPGSNTTAIGLIIASITFVGALFLLGFSRKKLL